MEILFPVFSRFWTEYRDLQSKSRDLHSKSPYLVQIGRNMDQKYSEYGHFSRNEVHTWNLSRKLVNIPSSEKHLKQTNITEDSEVLAIPCFGLYMSKTMVSKTNEIIIITIITIKIGQAEYCEFPGVTSLPCWAK